MRMKKLLTFLTLLTLFTLTAGAETESFDFSFDEIGSTGWTQNYVDHTISGTVFNVVLSSSSKQSATITDIPVTKGGQIQVTQKDVTNPYTITGVELKLRQWTNKKQTVTLKVSDDGTNWTTKSSSDNFELTETGLSAKLLRFNFFSTSNQVGIESLTITYTTGGGDVEKFNINYETPTNGAFASGNPTLAAAETNVTITTEPANGYKLSSVTVTPSESDVTAPTATVTSNTTATFTMPASAVTVKATFEKIETALYERVTSISANDIGKKFIIVCEDSKTALSGIRSQESITITTHSTELPDGTPVNIYTLGGEDGAYTFLSDGKYMANTGTNNQSSLNHLAEPEEDDMAQWDVSFGNQYNAIIQCLHKFSSENGRFLRANGTNDFRCYTTQSNGKDIFLYKEVTEVVEADDLYIVGHVNGNDEDPFDTNEGVKLTYSQSNDNYAGDFYCTGMKEGYSYFLFSKKVPYSFSNTSDLYGAGADGGVWLISENGENESHFGDAIPLFATSTDNFRIPAGLYTVTVKLSGATGDNPKFQWTDKSIVVTKRDVTMAINSSGSNYFDDTKEITMTSNLTELGGKIYYTTNGGNPSDPNSGRIEYTGPVTINATTTFKAVAYVGNLYSPIAEKTYYKMPAKPVINPNGGYFTEPVSVSISCATQGATIYYTTNGDDPTNESTPYTAPFTLEEETTVKAIAYITEGENTIHSDVTTATFTFGEPVVVGEGDFQLVTKASQLVAGNELIIVTTFEDLDENDENVTYNYAMGALTGKNPKGSETDDFTFNGVIGNANSAITAGSGVNILKLGGSEGAYTLQQESDEKYISLSTSSTDISATNSGSALNITIGNDFKAYIGNNSPNNNRQILHQAGTSNVFGNYASSNVGGANYSEIYLYYREVPATPKTLAEIVALGAAADGKKYCINENLLGVYMKEKDNTVWFKDEVERTIELPNNVTLTVIGGAVDFDQPGGENNYWFEKLPSKNFDQSNWIEVDFSNVETPEAVTGKEPNVYIKNLTGIYSYNGGKRKLVLTKTPATTEVTALTNPDDAYVPNPYIPANFYGSQQGYFFSKPKVQEYAKVVDAQWNGTKMVMGANNDGLIGSFTIKPVDGLTTGKYYTFHGIISRSIAGGDIYSTPRLQDVDYDMETIDLVGQTGSDVPTAISTIETSNGEVKSVKYVSVAGVVSDRPFQGVNIVVTEYTDGSRTTAKVVK